MNNKHFLLFFFILVAIVPFGYAATEDAIREVGFSFTAAFIGGLFAYLMFYLAFKLDECHEILKLFLFLVGMSGILTMTGSIADQGGKYFTLFKVNIYLLYGIVAYLMIALFLKSITYLSKSQTGGKKDV